MRRVAALCFVAWIAAVGAANAKPRIALVIGNSRYTEKGASLAVAGTDAMAVAEALCSVGFDVDQVIDATHSDMIAAITRYQTKLEANPGAETVVFYSGHGAEYEGVNFLIPVDMKRVVPARFAKSAVGVEMIYDAFRFGEPQFAMVMLDACRTSPFADNARITNGLAQPRSSTGGPVPLGLPPGTITAFATDPRKSVSDAPDGKHSAYAKAILQSLGEPGLTLTDFFIRVRCDVGAYTNDGQHPWESTGQKAPFLFRDPAFLRVAVTGDVDDDLMITAGAESYIYSLDGGVKQLKLNPGDNVVTTMMVNFRSINSGNHLEGWHYDASLSAVGGSALIRQRAREEEPPLARWGGTFIVARALVNVDSLTGAIRVVDEEPVVWEDGFSLLGTEPSNRLYESIRWAVVYKGIPLFGDFAHFPGTARSVAEIAADVRNKHHDALAHRGPSPHEQPDAIAHRPHLRAIELLEAADERSLVMVIDRVRRELRGELETNLGALFEDPDPDLRKLMRALAAERKYYEIRYLYEKQYQSKDRVKHLLGTVSNEELEGILARHRE